MKYYNNKARQAGMTLIELTVVLLVLVGLAGLMIPYVSGFVSKTHDSTGSNNLARLNNNIQRFQSEFMSFPDDFESLVENTSGNIYTDLMNPALFTVKSYDVATDDNVGDSLRAVGISSVMEMVDGGAVAAGDSATFASSNGTTVAIPGINAVAGTFNLATVAKGGETSIEDHLAEAFGGQPSAYNATCYDYIAFGVGQDSELIGRTMSDAPVHFAQNGDMGPNNKYNRFIAVFEVDRASGTQTVALADSSATALDCSLGKEPAKFIGSAMAMMPGHMFGLAHSLGHTYENIAEK